MELTFNGFDLVNPVTGYNYGVTQVDFGNAKYRGENISLPFLNGRKYIKKLKDQRIVTVTMQANTENDVGFLHPKFYNSDDLFLLHYKIGSFVYDYNAECTDFKYTAMPFNFKINIEFTIPREA